MWVLMAVTVGGSLFGIVGMLTFIPICSVCYALFRLFVNERLKERGKYDNYYTVGITGNRVCRTCKRGRLFVEGSSAVAGKLKIPGVVIGLTIVAMGTSAPELAVSVSAAIAGSNEIAISNIIGSDIFNLVLIFAICAVITPVTVDRGIMKRDFRFQLLFP